MSDRGWLIGAKMRPYLITILLLIGIANASWCQKTTIEIDAITGYRDSYQEPFNQYLRPLLYLSDFTASPVDESALKTIKDLGRDLPSEPDEYFDYKNIYDQCLKQYQAGKLDFLLFEDTNLLHAAVFVEPESKPSIKKPSILINKVFLKAANKSLSKSSLLREMKYAQDYFDRVANNRYTHWDELENLLYLMDAYYAQAHFIEDAYQSKKMPITRIENFLVSSYHKDTLSSFFFFFYGIDRQIVVNGYASLAEFLEGKTTMDEFYANITQTVDGSVKTTAPILSDGDGKIAYAIDISYLCYYSFLLHHRKIANPGPDSDKLLKKLLLIQTAIDSSHRASLKDFQDFVLNYQTNPILAADA